MSKDRRLSDEGASTRLPPASTEEARRGTSRRSIRCDEQIARHRELANARSLILPPPKLRPSRHTLAAFRVRGNSWLASNERALLEKSATTSTSGRCHTPSERQRHDFVRSRAPRDPRWCCRLARAKRARPRSRAPIADALRRCGCPAGCHSSKSRYRRCASCSDARTRRDGQASGSSRRSKPRFGYLGSTKNDPDGCKPAPRWILVRQSRERSNSAKRGPGAQGSCVGVNTDDIDRRTTSSRYGSADVVHWPCVIKMLPMRTRARDEPASKSGPHYVDAHVTSSGNVTPTIDYKDVAVLLQRAKQFMPITPRPPSGTKRTPSCSSPRFRDSRAKRRERRLLRAGFRASFSPRAMAVSFEPSMLGPSWQGSCTFPSGLLTSPP